MCMCYTFHSDKMSSFDGIACEASFMVDALH